MQMQSSHARIKQFSIVTFSHPTISIPSPVTKRDKMLTSQMETFLHAPGTRFQTPLSTIVMPWMRISSPRVKAASGVPHFRLVYAIQSRIVYRSRAQKRNPLCRRKSVRIQYFLLPDRRILRFSALMIQRYTHGLFERSKRVPDPEALHSS